MAIIGTSGNDFIHVLGDGAPAYPGATENTGATDAADEITSGGGGDDHIYAGGGSDAITFQGDLTAADIIDGGAGQDILELTGVNLVTFAANSLTGIETIIIDSPGIDPNILWLSSFTFVDANIAAGASFSISAKYAGSNHDVFVDWSRETDAGVLYFTGGGAYDTVIGNTHGISEIVSFQFGGTDRYVGNGTVVFDAALDSSDRVVGGGDVVVALTGNYNMTLTSTILSGVAAVEMRGSPLYTYTFTLDASLVAAGETMTFDGVFNTGAISINGSAIAGNLILISGREGNDTLIGGAGDDLIVVGSEVGAWGTDHVDGGAGDDVVNADTAYLGDVFDGGAGRDLLRLTGSSSNGGISLFSFQLGTNVLGFETISLGAGIADYAITATNAAVAAGATVKIDGSGLIGAGSAHLKFDGSGETDGKFIVIAGTGADELTGGAAADNLSGGFGADRLNGGAGADVLDGGVGADFMDGGDGADIYTVDSVRDVVSETVNDGDVDVVNASRSFTLGDFIDELNLIGAEARSGTGNAINNIIRGNGAANVLNGKAGADEMRGGGGNDLYFVDNAGDKIIEASNSGTDTASASTTYALASNVENLILSGANAINGSGNGLANNITGNSGNNSLNGGGGSDTLTGGLGRDSFLFRDTLGASNIDTVTDYNVADDTIRLDDSVFTHIGPVGALASGLFRIGASAADATDRIIYNQTTGQLFYDPDGIGGAAQIHFATLAPGLAMNTAEFAVI